MSNAQELMANARVAIGSAEDDDWMVNPVGHARKFQTTAPKLAANLMRARAETLAGMFNDEDKRAVIAKVRFQRTVSRADTAVFLASSLGALLLVAVALQAELGDAARYVTGGIGALGVFASGLATMWVQAARNGRLAEQYVIARGAAEEKRITYFKDVVEGATNEPSDQLMALEYCRRFLLDSQLSFFKYKGSSHEQAAQDALDRSTYATFLASFLTAAGGFVAIIEPKYAVVAGLGSVATYLGRLFMSRSEMNLDQGNAERYRVARHKLAKHRLELDRYRLQVANGDPDALRAFFQPISDILQDDFDAFNEAKDKLDGIVTATDKSLADAQSTLDKGKKDAMKATEAGNRAVERAAVKSVPGHDDDGAVG